MILFSMSVWPILLILSGAVLLSVALTVLLSVSLRRHSSCTRPASIASPCQTHEANPRTSAQAQAAFCPISNASSAISPTDSPVPPAEEVKPAPEADPALEAAPVEPVEPIPESNFVVVEREALF